MPQYANGSFAGVLDKGTLDAVLCWYGSPFLFTSFNCNEESAVPESCLPSIMHLSSGIELTSAWWQPALSFLSPHPLSPHVLHFNLWAVECQAR